MKTQNDSAEQHTRREQLKSFTFLRNKHWILFWQTAQSPKRSMTNHSET